MVFLGIRVAVGSTQKISPVVSARSTPVSVCLSTAVGSTATLRDCGSESPITFNSASSGAPGGKGRNGVDGNVGARLGLR